MVDYYTPAQLGAKLQLKVRTVQVQALKGEIPGARKIGRQWRFCALAVDAWLNPPAPAPVITYQAKLAALDRFK